MVIGAILSMFIYQPVCMHLPPSATQAQAQLNAVWLTILFLAFGSAFLTAWVYKTCCPRTICDFWQAIIYAMSVAFVGSAIVFTFLQPGGVTAIGLAVAVALIYAIIGIATAQIVINQNNNKC